MNNLKFSVLITVYNASSIYLCECIDSVIGQTYENLEIIVIDDGSNSDETLSCLERYKSTNNGTKELIIRHQPNGGQGKARNAGMSIATGDYWAFLDSDDYYMSDTLFSDLAVLLDESNADLCVFEYEEFFDDSLPPKIKEGSLSRDRIFGKPTDEALKILLSAPKHVFSAATHTKVIKASMMKEHNIISIEGLKNEDNYLTAKMICYAKTFDRYNKVVYAYRRSNISSLSAQHDNSLLISKDILSQFDVLLSDNECNLNRNVLDFLASPLVYVMGKVVSVKAISPDADIRECLLKIKKYSYILKYSSRHYIRTIGIIMKVFGLSGFLYLLKIFLKMNRKHVLSINRKVS